MKQVDIVVAFLNRDLKEIIHIEPPEGPGIQWQGSSVKALSG
jgi:hypothetical protein